MFSAAPEQQAQEQSVPCRTSTASARSQCSPPDLNHKESPKIYQIECQKECQKICQIHRPENVRENVRTYARMNAWKQIECERECQSICQKESQILSDRMLAQIYAIYTSRWYVRNYVRIVVQGGDHSKKVVFIFAFIFRFIYLYWDFIYIITIISEILFIFPAFHVHVWNQPPQPPRSSRHWRGSRSSRATMATSDMGSPLSHDMANSNNCSYTGWYTGWFHGWYMLI